MSRDPSVDPRVGDKIHGICIGVGGACSYTVLATEGEEVTFTYGGNHRSTVPLHQWHRWSCGKRFTRAGEDQQHRSDRCRWTNPLDPPVKCEPRRKSSNGGGVLFRLFP